SRHTIFSRDWSSDVCSSDLQGIIIVTKFIYIATNAQNKTITGALDATDKSAAISILTKQNLHPVSIKEGVASKGSFSFGDFLGEIGRATCRERVDLFLVERE